MPRYFIQLLYNGANYNGWQVQSNTPNTIQQVLNDKLSILLGKKTEVVGCGRTDTGVHAKNYFAHFDCDQANIHEKECNLVYKLNKILPLDIAVKNVFPVKDEASSRFDAESRTYEYYIHRYKDPFLFNNSLYVFGKLDIELMNVASEYLLSVTDFTSFSKVNTQNKTNNCKVTYAKWKMISENEYVFQITANRFLRNMVRAIVGTLLEIGKEKLTYENFKTIISSQNRSAAGMSVPAHALYLVHIQYPETIFYGK